MADYGTDSPDWEGAAVGVGRRAADPQQELLGDHRVGRRRPARHAGLGRVERRRPAVHVLVRADCAQGPQHPCQPTGRVHPRQHRRGVSVEGTAAPITDPDRIDTWIDRYVAKYSGEVPEGLGDFVRQHAMFEVVPTVAFAVIEREDEFALRATRWRFA